MLFWHAETLKFQVNFYYSKYILMWSACHKKSYLTNLEVRNLKSEISCLCPVWLSQFCLFWKKMGKGFVNIPKFVNSTHNKYLFLWHADHIKVHFFVQYFQIGWKSNRFSKKSKSNNENIAQRGGKDEDFLINKIHTKYFIKLMLNTVWLDISTSIISLFNDQIWCSIKSGSM